METTQLRDSQVIPDNNVISQALQGSFTSFEKLMQTITNPNFGIVGEWNYYNDGKAWLFKAQYKKKTVFWLSCWDGFFKTTFYFTEKNCSGLLELEIDENIKKEFVANKPIGKLMPLTINMYSIDLLPDLLKIIEYKMKLK